MEAPVVSNNPSQDKDNILAPVDNIRDLAAPAHTRNFFLMKIT